MTSRPDFASTEDYSVRQERFKDKPLPFSLEQATSRKSAALAVPTRILPGCNGQVCVTDQNVLQIQCFDKSHDKGFCVDDFGALNMRWLRSLPVDAYRQRAMTCVTASLLLLDMRAEAKHGIKIRRSRKRLPQAKAIFQQNRNGCIFSTQ